MSQTESVLFKTYDARGNGAGEISCTITGEHQNRITDYTAILVGKRSKMEKAIVRRLTPLECERLQGYPDGWTDIGDWTDSNGKLHKSADSSRYKALGNSIALPFWAELAKAVVKRYDHPVTMGSLFDGISGFCVVFYKAGAKPIWSSEIEEFPIAVAKKHFGDDDTGEKGDVDKYVNQVLEEKPNFS